MEHFDTSLVFISNTFHSQPRIFMKLKNADLSLWQAASIFGAQQSSICNRAKHTLGSLNSLHSGKLYWIMASLIEEEIIIPLTNSFEAL